jgi:predicted ATPase
MLTTLAIANYRSLRKLIIPLGQLNLVTGPNGSGKSSVYRALRLLAETARGGVVPALAREGGLQSTLWAGPEKFSDAMLRGEVPVQGTVRKDVINLKLGFASDQFSYAIDLGLPTTKPSAFSLDPEIKRECIWYGPVLRPSSLLVDRRGALLRIRDKNEDWQSIPHPVRSFESMMSEFSDPTTAPEMITVREQIRSWRFYDHFRTDMDAPARHPQIGTHTPVLSNDGTDLAAAIQTILEIGDRSAFNQAVADAFPGSSINVSNREGRFEIEMAQDGLLRPLKATELSDGTLRYLLLIAALLTPRPPTLLVLNEPETSLHPDLLPALGKLIVHAAKNSQILVVSHASRLIAALEREPDSNSIVLEKILGATNIIGMHHLDMPTWEWPKR